MSVRILTAEERRQGLGGTDVAAIVGVSGYRSPIEVYQEKVGEAEPLEQTWRMRLGQIFEDAIADAYAESTGRTLTRSGVVFHREHEFLYVHPDRKVVGEPGLVECKKWAGRVDEVSPSWRVQAQWQMALTGREWVDVVPFHNDIDPKRVVRDDALIDDLVAEAVRFWTEHVVARIPPPVDGSAAYAEYMRSRYQRDEVKERSATPEEQLLFDELHQVREAKKAAAAHEQLIKNRLEDAMDGPGRLVAPGARAVLSWREEVHKNYVEKARWHFDIRFTKEEG